MKLFGFVLVALGFIMAALAAVVDQSAINAAEPNAVEPNVVETADVSGVETADESAVEPNAVEPNVVEAADESTVETADVSGVKWLWYVPALAVGAIGVVMIRTAEARHSKTEHHVAANIEAVEGSLQRIADNITKLNAEKDTIDTYEVRHRIDELFAEDLEQFVDARESIAHRYGLAAYGNVMSSFAAGERYLNRVWSASADGYIDEVNEYLEKAKDQFNESLNLLCRLPANPQPA